MGNFIVVLFQEPTLRLFASRAHRLPFSNQAQHNLK